METSISHAAETAGISTSLSESSRQSRIHFPADDTSPLRSRYLPPEIPPKAPSPAFKSSPIRRHSPLNPHTGNSTNPRRRVRSVDTTDIFSEPTRPRRIPALSLIAPLKGANSLTSEAYIQEDYSSYGIFSDEYELSHEDPRILQDVQRALKLKARREARMGQPKAVAQQSGITSPSLSSTRPSFKQAASPGLSSPSPPRKGSVVSDIDFSPSIGISSIHPIPASLDNGITLDWSGFAFDDHSDRRWKLQTTKRKEKEKEKPVQLTTIIDQQEKTYSDKIARIRTIANSHTLQKAKITRDQLGRRYNLINSALSTGSPLNSTKVARWYGTQDPLIRSSLEKAEPFTWLRHLDKRSSKPLDRPRWHLSALITEEYINAQARYDVMKTIPEDSSPHSYSPNTSLNTSPTPSVGMQSFSTSPKALRHSIGPALIKRSSFEGRISFEPTTEHTQKFVEEESLQNDKSYNNIFNESSNHAGGVSSPNNSSPRRDFLPPVFKKFIDNSGGSSPGDLTSDHSDPGDGIQIQGNRLRGSTGAKSDPEAEVGFTGSQRPSDNEDVPQTGITLKLTIPTPGENTDSDLRHSAILPPPAQSSQLVNRVAGRRRARTSLPSLKQASRANEYKRQQEDDEKAHELRTRLLNETTAHNRRIRQLLNRVSASIREYETARSNAMTSLAISHKGLPRELLDAFSHDPAAVTGATRRFHGWRAVDDIHKRLVRQREIFQGFLSCLPSNVSVPRSILDDPIAALLRSVETLEVHKSMITKRAASVDEILDAVQGMHTSVKERYKTTLSHTSVVYPELSYIVALEESYKDQYQQFWEFGMDTLTFLLDTVTPFWRTYGKTIGEDVRDFLIIPLYRNEFTGESKRYPILGFPSRSARHWLGLALFFLVSVMINILQARAALSSATLYRLPMIPYETIRWTALPFFWIGIIIQWWAVVAEFAIVLMQVGVLLWWVGWSVKLFT